MQVARSGLEHRAVALRRIARAVEGRYPGPAKLGFTYPQHEWLS